MNQFPPLLQLPRQTLPTSTKGSMPLM
jgi:hypothetical protein